MNRLKFLYLWSFAVGAMDACTGLLLIVAPALVLKMLLIPEPSHDALVFLSWMGVFIAGVGLSYSQVLRGRAAAETVWGITAGIRVMVGGFICWKIATHELALPWGLVACTDLLVAAGQIILLRMGWWKGGRG